MDLSDAVLGDHAVEQMAKREISEAEVRGVLAQPEEIRPVRSGRVVAQGMVGRYLLRVSVDVDRHPPEVVTVYRTSQIRKYRTRP